MSALTPKQRAFDREYVKDDNRRQAAIRAGYRIQSASERGGKLLHDPRVQALIEKLRAAQVEPDDMSLLGHVRSLAAIRDEARAAKKFQAAAQAERARGYALGFQQAGAGRPDPEPPPAKEEVDWEEVIMGQARPPKPEKPTEGAPNQAARPGASKGASDGAAGPNGETF